MSLLLRLGKQLLSLLGLVALLGLSLMPLAALLLMMPAVMPQESVLSESTRRTRSFWSTVPGRVFAVLAGLAMAVALIAFAIEVVSRLSLPDAGVFADFFRDVIGYFPSWIGESVPDTFVRRWPYIVVFVYLTDLLFVFAIGRIPLRYNVRNLTVRWKITLLTGLAFTVVVALLTSLLTFINGMNDVTANSGVPGNVIVLSEGATDELFSNLPKSEIASITLTRVTHDRQGRPLKDPIRVARDPENPDGLLASPETYFVLNQPVSNADGSDEVKFVQLRGIVDPALAARVHGIELKEGKWFSEAGTRAGRFEAVLGEGMARSLGHDIGKPTLEVGDEFLFSDEPFVVAGIMDTRGTTADTEVWARWSLMAGLFDKQSFTTLILRVDDGTDESAELMAWHLNNEYTQLKLKAQTEKAYFHSLNNSNKVFLTAILVVAGVMAVGGIFGVMNTMYAAISQRTKDIGVLRVIGFKRWQVLVSFMLESLVIALFGGLLGCALGYLADGREVSSFLIAGNDSFKISVMKMRYDADVLMCGVLFTLVMGRVGGLLPALTAMRMRILESLR